MHAIIGASGNTGSVVARKLLAHGEKVRVIGRDAKRLESLVQERRRSLCCQRQLTRRNSPRHLTEQRRFI